jgi:hypothetical protein
MIRVNELANEVRQLNRDELATGGIGFGSMILMSGTRRLRRTL